VATPQKKKELHPALRANAERLKRGEPLHSGKSKTTPQRPKIRSKKRGG
jgi:hypothetical protein